MHPKPKRPPVVSWHCVETTPLVGQELSFCCRHEQNIAGSQGVGSVVQVEGSAGGVQPLGMAVQPDGLHVMLPIESFEADRMQYWLAVQFWFPQLALPPLSDPFEPVSEPLPASPPGLPLPGLPPLLLLHPSAKIQASTETELQACLMKILPPDATSGRCVVAPS